MKKIALFVAMLVIGISYASAQTADIKFDKTTHDFGTFSENNPVVSCVFTFTNIGDAPLVIHQAVASCGCTVPEYTQEPIMPGKTGTIKVTYNGTDKYPGHFKKSITLRTNAKTEMLRLYIHGMSYSEIARKMDCSTSGVRWNFQEMIARAGYSCKEDLIAAALESKLIVTTLK